MPEHVSFELGFPTDLGDADELRAEVERRVTEIEREKADDRRSSGRKILGRAAVLRQSWKGAPTTFEARRQMSPRVAARNIWARMEALLRIKAFVRAYADARSRWLQGEHVVFPPGTYWLRRFANVEVAAS